MSVSQNNDEYVEKLEQNVIHNLNEENLLKKNDETSKSSSEILDKTLKMSPGTSSTRIPQLSPQLQGFRRTQSLRMRTSTSCPNDIKTIAGNYSHLPKLTPIGDNNNSNCCCCCGNNLIKSIKTANTYCNNYPSNGVQHKHSTTQDTTKYNNKLTTTNNANDFAKRENGGMSLNLTNNTSGNSFNCSPRTPRTPKTPDERNLPILSGGSGRIVPKTPPVTPDSPLNNYLEDDIDSLHSYSSMASGRSGISCDHGYVARNGTTFSGRKMKYVVHCSTFAGQTGEDYLTPTQRAQRQIRRLKELLAQVRMDLEQKDSEILKLTKEVVELRLFKASLSSPDERSNSSDAVTVRENTKTSQDVSPIIDMTDDILKQSPRHHGLHQVQYMHDKLTSSDMQGSFADSGHFEDITTSSMTSKDSYVQTTNDELSNINDDERQRLIQMYELRIDELINKENLEQTNIKCNYNNKIEALLNKLSDCNTNYSDMVVNYEQAKEKINELEQQLGELELKLNEQNDKQNKMYLHMYTKGQEAERLQHADQVLEFAKQAPSRVSVPELLQQLQVTQDELENIRDTCYQPASGNGNSQILLSAKEAISLWLLGARKTMYRRLIEAQQKHKVDPEITLQFLKSAIYYFLTDKENSQGHLNAIESILGFSDLEKKNIDRARTSK